MNLILLHLCDLATILCVVYLMFAFRKVVDAINQNVERLSKSKEHEVKIVIFKNEDIKYVKKEEIEKETKGANRKPRTDEQKLSASLKRKEWWDKKRQDKKSPGAVSFKPPQDPNARPRV